MPRPRHYLINLTLGALNALLNIGISSLIVGYYVGLEKRGIGLLHLRGLSGWANIGVSFLVLDCLTYLIHRAYHEIPSAWRLHKVHHSDLDLDVSSASRFHPGEILLSSAAKMGCGFLLGPSALALAWHEAWLLLAAQFQHANFRLPEHWESRLKTVLVTPDMHRIHHSAVTSQTNSNYSNLFSVWDRIFKTYVGAIDQKSVIIGLKEYRKPASVSLPKLLAMPFVS